MQIRHTPLVLAIAIALGLGLAACAERSVSERDRDARAAGRDAVDEQAVSTAETPPATLSAEGRVAPAKLEMRQSNDAPRDRPSRLEEAKRPVEAEPTAAPAPVTIAAQAIGDTVSTVASAPAPAGSWRTPDNTENYAQRVDNAVTIAREQPLSTFSIDVDTGSYTNVRRMLEDGALPPADAVRAEEFINYFDYGYTPPTDLSTPFSITTELAPAPWNAQRTLMLVGIKGFEIPKAQIPAANLVFLIDTSGSMDDPRKLPLLVDAFKQLVPQLREQDRVSIVVYAGSAGLVLEPTAGDRHAQIIDALERLSAGGSTNGGAGIDLAYAMAQQGFIKGGVNRVILATDGDFNVGTVDTESLKTMIADKRRSGIALTTLGFGDGNYNDEIAEQLADAGNGNHAYIDSAAEARKVLVDEMSSTMLTIAKDVKIQVEFNPAVVAEYRLIGYENRMLRREDFNNDQIDAGEIGAGHDVTALYELTLVGSAAIASDPLRYAAGSADPPPVTAKELAFLKLRFKQPSAETSTLVQQPILRRDIAPRPSQRLAFAAAVAAFADQLRGGSHVGDFDLERTVQLARAAGDDRAGYRAGFVDLVRRAQALQTPALGQTPTISR